MYKQEKKEKSVVSYAVTASAEEFEAYIQKAYDKTKSKYSVQGFRKGKAPRKVIEQNYGKEIFMEDALLELANETYEKILAENTDLVPVGRPEIEVESLDKNGAKFKIKIAVRPEVKLGAYTGLELEKAKEVVSEKAVEAELSQLQNRQARFVVAQRAAQNGDFVTIDFLGKIDGVPFDGGKAEDYRLELGSNTFIPGFEEQVVGMEIGQKRTINVKFPDDYFNADMKGKAATFDITLTKVEEKELPELNDDFASNVSEFNTLAELKADIEKHLAESVENQNRQKDENTILEAIVKTSEMDIPEVMIQEQLDRVMEDMKMRLSYQGFSMEDYLDMMGSSMDAFRAGQRENAVNSVKTQLVISEIIKKEGLKVEPEELDQKLQEIAEKYGKTLEEYKKTISNNEFNYIANDIIITKLFDFLFKNNTLK
ncbi:MAG: trigger factor [Clostridia bacterium]|nr:trigger factor [Clostridia bacterium]MBR2433271.1 trigger factor [Clostridia bacterium]